jgi:SSS family solute:Na+ symporter
MVDLKLIFIFIYVGLISIIGLFSMRKVKNLQDYYLGGRAVNPWMSAFSYGTSYFSAVVFIGYAGKLGWSFGMSTMWIVVGNCLVGTYLAWKVLGKRTREMTQRLNASTMPEFIGIRYKSRALKIVTALIIFIFLVPYSASVFMGLSYLFEQVFNVPYIIAMVIMVVITAGYLLMGGFIAATRSDFVQGLVMLVGSVLMVVFVLSHSKVDGMVNAYNNLKALDGMLVAPVGPPGLLPLISLVVLTSLGSWGLPQMVHKFYTIRDARSIKYATVVSTIFSLVITFCAYYTGSLSRLFFPEAMPMAGGVANPDLIIPRILGQTQPDFMLGLIMILIISASVSTLASVVLASSSAIAIDLVKGTLKPDMPKKKVMLIMRILTAAFVVLSFVMAILPNPIITMAALSWGVVAGSLLAPYLLGLFWKGVTRAGAWAGIVTAVATSLGSAIYFNFDAQYVPIFSAAAIVLPLIVVPVVSVFTRQFSREHIFRMYPYKGLKDIKSAITAEDTV